MTPPDDTKNRPPDWASRSNGFFNRRKTLQSPNEALQPETAPPPPPALHSRKRPRLSALSGFLSFVLIIAVVSMFVVTWGIQRLTVPGPLTGDKVVIIPHGDVLEISNQLEREGVIDNTMLFNAALVVTGDRSKLKEGEYLFKQSASLREVMDVLVSGKQVLHAITLPEGLTSEQIVQRLNDSDVLGSQVRDTPKEGSLLPETYKVTRGTSRNDLIKKMQDDQRKAVDQIWARRSPDLPLRSPYELIILASIVEKETGKADERPRVAGVFINRLQKRMRLQSDPTIVYGLVGGKGSLGHSISRAELDKFSPYNTYLIDGLPPGPIANPGRAALEAVANPSRTSDLYFVADGTGGHVFADTIDQHNRNVQRWRQIEKDAKDKVAPDVTTPAVPRAGQKSDLSDTPSVYGALSESLMPVSASSFTGSSMISSPAEVAIARLSSPLSEASAPTSQTAKNGSKSAKPLSAFNMGPSVDDISIAQPGAHGRPSAADALDGPADPVQASDVPADKMPFAGVRHWDPKLAAAQFEARIGAAAKSPAAATQAAISTQTALVATPQANTQGANASPVNTQIMGAPPVNAQFSSAQPTTATVPSGHPAIYDVSEGTSLDPLLDKSYDLNHPKSVPSLK